MLHFKLRIIVVSSLLSGALYANPEEMPSLELVVQKQSLSHSLSLGEIEVTHTNNAFFVDGEKVPSHRIDAQLRAISSEKLSKLLQLDLI